MMSKLLNSLLVGFIVIATPAFSQDVTPEQKKELAELSKTLRDAKALLRKKKFEEVRTEITKSEEKLKSLGFAEDERDRTYKAVLKSLSYLKDRMPVSFEREVAPIIKEKCLRCHGPNRQSGRLRLDTFNRMAKGGANGPLVRGRNPRSSLLVARLATKDEKLRMPKNGTALPDDQVQLIARWVSQGAGFDGADRDIEIGSKPKEPEKPIVIARPDGSETVSFKKDIAPWMVGVCLGCHGTRNPRNEFSLATFEGIMRGGESGPAVMPGDPDNSYIVDLVLRQDPVKMPAGNQTRIKRSQAKALETWVKEGAKFDGGDAKAPLRDLVPTAAELETQRLAGMSASEFTERRLQQGKDMWERVLPRDEMTETKTGSFYVLAADESRGRKISEWAEADVAVIKTFFKYTGDNLWRGRLNIFVAKDRFAYEEFNQVVFNRQTPKEMTGHSVVTSGFNQAYIVLQDVGDEVDEKSPGLRSNLTVQLVDAFLNRLGSAPPKVISRGTGLVLAAKSAGRKDPWFTALPLRLKGVSVARPQEVFDDGSFTPGERDSVGHALAGFMMKANEVKYVQFTSELQKGTSLADASRKVYRQSPAQLGTAFMRSLK